MRGWRVPIVAAAVLALGFTAPPLKASDDDARLSVTVSFGAGLNTATPPGNPANHHILPPTFKVRAGGVVNFVVAGFHWIYVFDAGTPLAEIQAQVPAGGAFVFPPTSPDPAHLFFKGLSPGPPAPATAANFSGARNRVESVSFATPGTYLVICNIRGHFLDGMFAFVEVVADDDHDHGGHKGHKH